MQLSAAPSSIFGASLLRSMKPMAQPAQRPLTRCYVLPRRKMASVEKTVVQAGGGKRAPNFVQIVIDHPFEYFVVCGYAVACYLITQDFFRLGWPFFVVPTGAQLVITTLQCMNGDYDL